MRRRLRASWSHLAVCWGHAVCPGLLFRSDVSLGPELSGRRPVRPHWKVIPESFGRDIRDAMRRLAGLPCLRE